MERLSSDGTVAVSDNIAIFFLTAVVLGIAKSMYDLIKSKQLTPKEKTNLAFIISIAPIMGAIFFYSYQRNLYKSNRLERTFFK